MSRAVSDWNDAAANAYTHLTERKRNYDMKAMVSLIDELCIRSTAAQSELLAHGSADFIATTLGHVTTAVHGPGSVPKVGGWYSSTADPQKYHVNSEFADAWKKHRRLPRS